MVISGPYIGYVWLFVCGASYLALFLGVVVLEWFEDRFSRADSKQVIAGARWLAVVFAFFFVPSVFQAILMIEREMLYTLASWLFWLHVVSFVANVALLLFWGWMLRVRFREHALLRTKSTVTQE